MAIFTSTAVLGVTLLVAKYVAAAKSKKHIDEILDRFTQWVVDREMNEERKQFILNRIQSIRDMCPDEANLEEYKRFVQGIFDDITNQLKSGLQVVGSIVEDVFSSVDDGLDAITKFLNENFDLNIPEEEFASEQKGADNTSEKGEGKTSSEQKPEAKKPSKNKKEGKKKNKEEKKKKKKKK